MRSFRAEGRSHEHASLTFVGTATTLLRLGGFTVLTDPNFVGRGQRVHLGYGLTSKRLTDPAFTIGALPPLDAVLLSHLHGDHFDRVARRDLPREPPVVTTPHAAKRLRRWGFGGATGLSTWQEWESTRAGERLRITSVPGRHGPIGVHRLLPPVMGSVLDLERNGERILRVYVTGDTLRVPELRAVHERFAGIDVMVTHLGGTKILGVLVTMDGRQGSDLVELIDPTTVVPVHYDDYGVFRSTLEDFVTEMRRRGHDDRLRTVLRGDTVELAPPPPSLTAAPTADSPTIRRSIDGRTSGPSSNQPPTGRLGGRRDQSVHGVQPAEGAADAARAPLGPAQEPPDAVPAADVSAGDTVRAVISVTRRHV